MKTILEKINESKEDTILENMLCETLATDILRDINKYIKKTNNDDDPYWGSNITSMKRLQDRLRVQLDKLTDDDIDEYDMDYVNKKESRQTNFFKEARRIISGKPGFIITYYNNHPEFLITNDKRAYSIGNSEETHNRKLSRFFNKASYPTATEILEYLSRHAHLVYIVHTDDKFTYDITANRNSNRPEPVGDAEYNRRLAEKNRERYKKIISQNRAAGDDTMKILSKIIDSITKSAVELSKDFAVDPSKYEFDYDNISRINKMVFTSKDYKAESILNKFAELIRLRANIKELLSKNAEVGSYTASNYNEKVKSLISTIKNVAKFFNEYFSIDIDTSEADNIKFFK